MYFTTEKFAKIKKIVGVTALDATADTLAEYGENISFVCTSTLREDILNHCFFVPGLPPILYDLMTAGGNEIVVFQPDGQEGEISVSALIQAMQQRHNAIIPVGYRTHSGALHMNPSSSDIIRWDEVEAIYCIGAAAHDEDPT